LLFLTPLISFAQPAWIDNGLVAYYPFNGDARDASGNGRNGTLVRDHDFPKDRFERDSAALELHGNVSSTLGGYVDLEGHDFSQIAGTESRTFSMWLKLDEEIYRTNNSIVVSYGFTGYPDVVLPGGPFALFIDNLETGVQARLWVPSAEQLIAYGLANGAWQHHLIAYDNQTGIGVYYVDGVKIAESLLNLNTPDDDICLGCDGEERSRFFDGIMDDVRIYNRALSSIEVAQLYEYESRPPGPKGVIRMVPAITVTGDLGSTAFIDIGSSIDGPWTEWKEVIIGPDGTTEVDLDARAEKRFYRIRK